MRAWVGCDFDGKLSVVAHRNSLLLYARANLHDEGARHVQVARSTDDGRTWSPFQLLQIDGINGSQRATNIYYFQPASVSVSHRHVQTAGQKASRRPGAANILVALMPAVLPFPETGCHDGGPCRCDPFADCEVAGGVFVSFSSDGVRWSRPESLLEASGVLGVRSPDHPISVIQAGDEGALSVLVLRNVDVTEKAHARADVPFSHKGSDFNAGMVRCPNVCNRTVQPRPFVCRYDFPPLSLARDHFPKAGHHGT
jgi:hypothetical protein